MKLIVERHGAIAYWILSGDGSVITLTPEIFDALVDAMERLGDAEGVVLTSDREDHFSAGADIDMLGTIADAAEGVSLARRGQAVFRAVERLPVPVVAALPGTCLGGALELALACHARIAAPGARLGLPEVRVGLLPGLGGTQRLPRLVGLGKALPLLLSGRTISARAAKRIGLLDAVAPAYCLRRAAEQLLSRIPKRKPARNRLAGLYKAIAKRKLPGGFRAPRRILAVLGKGEEAEAAEFGEAVASDESRHLMRIFHAVSKCKRGAAGPPPATAGVLGFGTMGAGIASALTKAGIRTRVREIDDEGILRGLERFRGDRDKLTLTTGWDGFSGADILIEAVPEDLQLKREVLAAAAAAAPRALLMSNTSSLSVEELGVVGMHFFNPVKRMPLVEVVAGPSTPPPAIRRARALAVMLGKVPVVVKDVPGFLVNRILGRYLAAAAALDASCDAIDAGARAHGFPMGPFEVLDMVGHDVARAVARHLHEAYGDRFGAEPRFRQGKRRRSKPADIGPALAALRDEAERCCAEGVADENSVDLACVMGFGYPAWRGSVLTPRPQAAARRAG